MSSANECCSSCESPTLTNIPGPEGEPGADGAPGADGISSFSETTADFVVPAINSNVTVFMGDSQWAVIGQVIFIEGAGYFEVVSKGSTTTATLTYLDYSANTEAGNNISTGAGVGPAGPQPDFSASVPTALTDNSTGTASNTIAAGVGIMTVSIPITLVQITGAADVLTTYTPGYEFKILSVDARVQEVVTTASKAVSLNLEIGTTNLTGGVVALTSANCTPLGAAIAGTPVTANNTGTAADTISVEAASVTAFSEGAVILLVRIQNMDTANAIASLADHINDLITAVS